MLIPDEGEEESKIQKKVLLFYDREFFLQKEPPNTWKVKLMLKNCSNDKYEGHHEENEIVTN
ncbi:9005_t:CDS:2 [Dentiscutata erythropus]|uniref:9005_t:CDS:1 n=1 Tax=Dentiscutata erythropus TaxID=1348616 RepID=A0A9N9GMT1_9GLOM|nr:9005_t:CDS:2 [Dentiscutata erythropus]